MYALPKVLPINELKNTGNISRMCKESHSPIVVTKNGYSDLVIMSVDMYEEMFAKSQAVTKIKQGLAELDSGAKTVDAFEFLDGLAKKYE